MPPNTRGKLRDRPIYVFVNTWVVYGFKSKNLTGVPGISEANLVTQLGQITQEVLDFYGEPIRIFGANAPKPPRVTRNLEGRKTFSTYCSHDYVDDAQAAGWRLLKPGTYPTMNSVDSPRSTLTAFVKLDRIYSEDSGQTAEGYYGFNLNKQDFAQYRQALNLLGIEQLNEVDRQKIFTGARSPKPGKASILTGRSNFSTFYDPSQIAALTTAGWKCTPEVI